MLNIEAWVPIALDCTYFRNNTYISEIYMFLQELNAIFFELFINKPVFCTCYNILQGELLFSKLNDRQYKRY